MRAITIGINKTVTEVDAAELTDYQNAVGGYIEQVMLGRDDVTLFVNEGGLLLDLPTNATLADCLGLPNLVGDAILVGLDSSTGDTTDLPDDVTVESVKDGSFRKTTLV